MPNSDISAFPKAKVPVTLEQLYRLYCEQDALITALHDRLWKLERQIEGQPAKPKEPTGLPSIPGVDWLEVRKRLPKMPLTPAKCAEYVKQRQRLNGEPSLATLVQKQAKFERTKGIHFKNLQQLFDCSYSEALGWLWFLRMAGLVKSWVSQDTYCKTDLEYIFHK